MTNWMRAVSVVTAMLVSTTAAGRHASAQPAPGPIDAGTPTTQTMAALQAALTWFRIPGGDLSTRATPMVLPTEGLAVTLGTDGDAILHRFDGTYWQVSRTGGRFESVVVPAVALTGPQSYPALFGVSLDHAMWYRPYATSAWLRLGGAFISSPSAVTFRGETYVFGVGVDEAVWYRTLSHGWRSLGGIADTDLALTTDGTSLYLVMGGVDDALWVRQLTGSTWAPWESLGGIALSYPATATTSDTGHVFVIGDDSAVWSVRVTNGNWDGWRSAGGIATSAPAAVADQSGRVTVFVLGTDSAMYSRWVQGASVEAWRRLGGVFASAPAADRTFAYGIGVDRWVYAAPYD